MTDKKIEVHPNAGVVGAIGVAGELGSNAAGAERTEIVEVPAATNAKPAFVVATVEAQIVEALVNAGFTAQEAVPMAQAAIAEIESRKGK